MILTGGDGRFFCNGFDLKYIHAHSSEGGLVDDLQQVRPRRHVPAPASCSLDPPASNSRTQATEMLMAKILKYKKVTVAAVNGHAAGEPTRKEASE